MVGSRKHLSKTYYKIHDKLLNGLRIYRENGVMATMARFSVYLVKFSNPNTFHHSFKR